jgi:3-deoxy-manno-octulosonate cytidylyltransferase (CMP-KDO synthetase)
MKVVGIIPARLNSTRLPRKALLAETGKSLVQHTWETAKRVRSFDQVIVATDSEEIAEVVRSFGGCCEMTGVHQSGTDRVAEVVRRYCHEAEIVVNLQGDEPELDPIHIDAAINALAEHPEWQMTTLVTPIVDLDVLRTPHVVKAVCAKNGRALYFSRAAVPFVRDCPETEVLEKGFSPWKQHVGVYVFRRNFLLELTDLPPSPLELLEKLEQLRALENGAFIGTVEIPDSSPGIDTSEDYIQFVSRMAQVEK